MEERVRARRNGRGIVRQTVMLAVLALGGTLILRADEPYARTKDYNLQHSKVALRFDLDQRKVIGDVTHTISLLRDGLDKIWFDSVGLQIESVQLNRNKATFETTEAKLIMTLRSSMKANRPKVCTSFYPTRIIRVRRSKSGRRASLKIRAITCRPMTIQTTG